MSAKSVSKKTMKTMQPMLSALTTFLVEHVVPCTNLQEEDVQQLVQDNCSSLVKIMRMTSDQKTVTMKKVKDPNAPKRGKSSYIFFCMDKREEIKEANPDMGAKEIIRELGRIWKEDMSDDEKQHYVEMSTQDKQRYEKEMETYVVPDLGYVEQKPKKSPRKGPKRGLTAYIYFCKENRPRLKEENPELSTKEITASLGARWKKLSDKERKPFERLAKKDKTRYEKEKAEWLKTEGKTEGKIEGKTAVSSKGKGKTKGKTSSRKAKTKSKDNKSSRKNNKTKASKPRKKSGYILFCQEEREVFKEENPEWTSQQVTQELGRTWRSLSASEKEDYIDRANSPAEEEVIESQSDSE